MSFARRVAVASLCIAAVIPVSAQAPAVDATKLLEQSTQFTQNLKTFYTDVSATMTQAGQTMPMNVKMWVQMPDKMHMRMEGPMGQATYLDGNTMITYMSQTNQYMKMQLPESPMKQMVSGLTGGAIVGEKQMTGATFVGKETKAGVPCNHLKVQVPGGGQGDLRIAEGAEPLPVYAIVKMAQPPIESEARMKWVVNQPIPANTFVFTPPAGAKEIQVPAGAGVAGAGAAGAPQAPASATPRAQ